MASKNHIELILMCCFFVMFVFMALADAKIKLENSYPNARYCGSIKTAHEALEICTTQAHESVQNGTCDGGVSRHKISTHN